MNKNELGNIFKYIMDMYPNFKLTESRIDAWHEILDNVDFNEAMSNLKKYVKQGKDFAPNPGQLITQRQQERYIPSVEETQATIRHYEEQSNLVDREAAERARIEAGKKIRELLGVDKRVQSTS